MSQIPPYENPYDSPMSQPGFDGPPPPVSQGKIVAPGVALIVVGVLGLLMTIVSLLMAFQGEPPAIDPDMPEFFQEMMQGAHGPAAALIQSVFLLVNALIIAGGVSMVRVKLWGLALTASILAMVNFGNCCCLLGLPVGIWSLVILLLGDVKTAFERNAW
jgi:hypothetical protein